MTTHHEVRRAILVVLDGLRPDAIERFNLSHIRELASHGASSLSARTVAPSLTNAAVASLLTGVSPQRHGIQTDRLLLPRSSNGIVGMPEVLARAGFPSSAFAGEVPRTFRGLAAGIGRRLGLGTLHLSGKTAPEILLAARSTLRTQRRGLIVFHWRDADTAGHDSGWMSEPYGEAARRMDSTMGMLAGFTDLANDEHTLVIVLADHGGGGSNAKNHESDHPLDRTIPLVLAGKSVLPVELGPVSLLDVPTTILWSMGVQVPDFHEGRVLREAFRPVDTPIIAVA